MAFDRFGPPEVLVPTSLPTPVPRAGEVLVRVGAVSVGRFLDVSARAGLHPFAGFQLPHVLGADHAGTVAACGPEVTTVEVGQHVAVFPCVSCGGCADCSRGRDDACSGLQVIGIHRPGAYAAYTVVPAENLFVVPDALSPASAAAVALVGAVAENQLTQAGMRAGDWVLVQGAASGLGSVTAALAAHRGARVIGTSRSPAKRAGLANHGVAAALDATDPGFASSVLALTDGRGVDIIIDNVGEPEMWRSSLPVLKTAGTIVTSGAFLGGQVEIDLGQLYLRCQRIIGVRTGTRASARSLWTQVANGFQPKVDRTFPLSEAAAAHRFLDQDANVGRVVLTVDDDSVESS